MALIFSFCAFALALVLLSLAWHFLNSEANPLLVRQAARFIQQSKSKPLKVGQTEQQVAVQLALAAGKVSAAAIVYKRLNGGSIFDARVAVDSMIRLRILTS